MIERNVFTNSKLVLDTHPKYSIIDYGITTKFNYKFLLDNPNKYFLYWGHSMVFTNETTPIFQEVIFKSVDGMFFYFSNRGSLASGVFPSYELRILYDIENHSKIELLINLINKKNQEK
jgi:hypothetical protein